MSSDDDDDGFVSPGDDSVDSSDDDVFTCKGTSRFNKSALKPKSDNVLSSDDDDDYSPKRRGRQKRGSPSLSVRLDKMDRKKRYKKEQEELRSKMISSAQKSDDEDDDSDIEVMQVTKSPEKATATTASVSIDEVEVVEVDDDAPATQGGVATRRMATRRSRRNVQPPPSSKPMSQQSRRKSPSRGAAAKKNSAAAAKNNDVVELVDDDSSDDDDDDVVTTSKVLSRKGGKKDVVDALKRSRQAAMSLRDAQNYHAEDIEVDVTDDAISTPTTLPLYAMYRSTSGATQQSVQSSAKIKATPKTNSTANNKALGKVLKFTCRTIIEEDNKKGKSVDKVLTIREKEPLQALLDKILESNSLSQSSSKVTMTFDGMTLSMSNTPASYDMENGDMIDVSVKTTNSATLAALERAVGSSKKGSPKKAYGLQLSLKLRHRIGKGKGNKLVEHNVKHRQNEPLENLMQHFKSQIAKASESQQFVFRFDGETLDLKKTPATYDMESMDLIDVEAVGLSMV